MYLVSSIRREVAFVVLVLTPLILSSAALADDGAIPIATVRPPTTVLRHVDAPELAVSQTASPGLRSKELVILVGGYQSCSCLDDRAFDALTDRLIAAGFDVVRFGRDPSYPYDTFGAIDISGAHLRDEIRSLMPSYAGVHIVTHSMGGVVADRAFAQGLSRDDGVLTYVSWSAPHSGSAAAMAAETLQRATGADGGIVRDGLLRARMEPQSSAANDLASTRPIPAPPGVVRLDLREATDVLVTETDARDPGVESRVLAGGLDGHGGILTSPDALDLTVATIATRRIPPDTRSRVLVGATNAESRALSSLALIALCVLTVAACVGAICFRLPLRIFGGVADRLAPHATRRRCA